VVLSSEVYHLVHGMAKMARLRMPSTVIFTSPAEMYEAVTLSKQPTPSYNMYLPGRSCATFQLQQQQDQRRLACHRSRLVSSLSLLTVVV